MATVSGELSRVKSNVTQFLPEQVIRDAAAAAGHTFRQRKLGPVQTVLLLVLQLLAKNAALAQARTIGGNAFSVSALCQARKRLPLALLGYVLKWLIRQVGIGDGPRVVLGDAINWYVPDTPQLRKKYRRPRQQRSRRDYPQVRTLGVFDLFSGLLLEQHHFASDRHESPQLQHVLEALRPGDIFVCDRGFISYANLCLLLEGGVHIVGNLSKKLWANSSRQRRQTRRLGKGDALVCWDKPERRPKACPLTPKQWNALPPQLHLRQITTGVPRGSGYRTRRVVIITSLTDATRHSAATIAQWYRRRWEVETDARHLKQTMNLEFLRTTSVENVERELLLRAIAYNLVRLAMVRAAELRGASDPGRISFADACRWLRESTVTGASLLTILMNPRRSRSARPRKVKYRGKNYRILKSQPRPQRKVA